MEETPNKLRHDLLSSVSRLEAFFQLAAHLSRNKDWQSLQTLIDRMQNEPEKIRELSEQILAENVE